MKWALKRDKTGWPWLESGEWRIAKIVLSGTPTYELWRGAERLGDYPTPEEAQSAATRKCSTDS